MSFGTVFNFVAELYPTNLRGTGLGQGSAVARVGGILAPQILYLKHLNPLLPTVVISAISILGAITRLEKS